jgi:hydroxyquinol 1,2-dioxygenase
MTEGHFVAEHSAAIVNARIGSTADPRLAEVMAALVRHLHAFAKEVRLTQQEWETGIEFLTQTGQICSDERQEFILLSDVLGLSMLVDALANPRPEGATQSTVLGPFHVPDAPMRAMGGNICQDGKGELCRYQGRVLDLEGQPVAGAMLDVWSDNADGFYDVQQPTIQPNGNNRGRFVTGADGAYHYVGIKPVSYPIPNDGPVGKMLDRLGRHPFRPAHMHCIVTAPGFQPLVTHTFVGDDRWIDSDAVFGVKSSLIAPFSRTGKMDIAWQSDFDFVLARE